MSIRSTSTGQLDTTLAPNGDTKLVVFSHVPGAKGRPSAAIDVSLANPLKVYFGDIHSHTS